MRKKVAKVVVGQRYGRLEVKELTSSITGNGIRRTMAFCVCDCGKEKILRSDGLTSGSTRSCGCLNLDSPKRKEMLIARNRGLLASMGCFSVEHPMAYRVWRSMITRCYNKNNRQYESYGQLGVFVCSWLRKHPKNLEDILGEWKEVKPSLDRFPIHNGNYTCGQCKECKKNGWKQNIRWATRKDQSENRGDFNVHLTAFGKTQLLSHWQEETGIDARRIITRIRRDGWSVEKALSIPDSKGNCYHAK